PPTAPANKSASPAPPRDKPQHAPAGPGGNTALNAEARLQSGANPRTKLTETELAAKMEQMRILNAEKTRKFEQAEQDERNHAEAYARGMEEARKRKKIEEEKRKRGEEERKRMDDERAKNRERKLKAMSMKEGGWDEGKEALNAEEERRGFRGANGGIRGARSAGLSGSRFANEGDEGERQDREPASNGTRDAKPSAPEAKAPAINTEEFPALPGKGKTGETSPPVLSPLGRWDDEMEALDAKMKGDAQA
ncbi:Polycystic kidney disease protein 1-like 3, partial [Colletotrichum sp. SAR 10_76]